MVGVIVASNSEAGEIVLATSVNRREEKDARKKVFLLANSHHSAVCFLAMEDPANLDGIRHGVDEEEAVIADAEAKFFEPSPECLNVAGARLCKAMQGRENAHRRGLVEGTNIGLRRFGPHDALHAGSL